jgi:hypothetical protein
MYIDNSNEDFARHVLGMFYPYMEKHGSLNGMDQSFSLTLDLPYAYENRAAAQIIPQGVVRKPMGINYI